MGKKGKKSRFNQVLDIDISYSSNSVSSAYSHLTYFKRQHLMVYKLDRLSVVFDSVIGFIR